MDEECAYKGCKSLSDDLFDSPSDHRLLKKWQKAVGTQKENFSVCVAHFRKRDIIVEKTLDENAIPIPITPKNDFKLNKLCCGCCLMSSDNPMVIPTKDIMKNFREITEYNLVTERLCLRCARFLKEFTKFNVEIKESHRKLRVNSEEEELRKHKRDLLFIDVETKDLSVCPHCPYRSYDKDSYLLHLCTAHGEGSNSKIKVKIGIECVHCREKFPSDRQLQLHQATHHSRTKFSRPPPPLPSKPPPRKAPPPMVIQSARSLAPGSSNLKKKRMQLLERLENSMKRRAPIVRPPSPLASIPKPSTRAAAAAASATKPPTRKYKRKARQQEKEDYYDDDDEEEEEEEEQEGEEEKNFEIFELDVVHIKEEGVPEMKKEAEEMEPMVPAIEIRNVEDILSNKNRRKQNIAKEQIEADVLFKEEPEEEQLVQEEELIVAEIVEEASDVESEIVISSDSSDESDSDNESVSETLNYIPPPKKSRMTDKKKIEDLGDKVQCLDCDVYMNIEELAEHRESMHTRTEEQFYDDIRNSNLPPLVKRKYKEKPEKSVARVSCTICHRLMQEWKLSKHMEDYHSGKTLPFLCHICCKTFPQITMLRYHMVSHDPNLQYRCDLCGRGFITKSKISKHINRTHLNIYTVRGVCTICNQKIYKASRVKVHMEKYHPNGLDEGFRANPITNYFDCRNCGASYADLYTFKRHDCGKGRYQLRCPDCNKPVKNEEYMQRHRETKCIRLNKHSVLNK